MPVGVDELVVVTPRLARGMRHLVVTIHRQQDVARAAVVPVHVHDAPGITEEVLDHDVAAEKGIGPHGGRDAAHAPQQGHVHPALFLGAVVAVVEDQQLGVGDAGAQGGQGDGVVDAVGVVAQFRQRFHHVPIHEAHRGGGELEFAFDFLAAHVAILPVHLRNGAAVTGIAVTHVPHEFFAGTRVGGIQRAGERSPTRVAQQFAGCVAERGLRRAGRGDGIRMWFERQRLTDGDRTQPSRTRPAKSESMAPAN